ncbi:hypothetical protein BMS3Bbin10_00043 [bacterium BMS3Bbin10]|nr:hypothetical protein BMS3Bbin10_00043 [bacterium BMS3Bbin10]HDL16437.1 sulfur relay protein DsrC [Hyphomicrobiales bacterium]
MARLSDLIIHHPEVQSFEDLVKLVAKAGQDGERFLEFDVKPDYRDTPRKWAMMLETSFYWGDKK